MLFQIKSVIFTICIFLLIGINSQIYGLGRRMVLEALKTESVPVIDGILNDAAWQGVEPVTGFTQFEPYNDRPATHQTYVWIMYDDNFLYIAARMIDPEPEKILTELGLRDRGTHLNSDQFWIDINPFDDGIYGFQFRISASGVQTDMNISHGTGGRWGRGDVNWDAVWMSDARITETGWEAEMRIPYSALRFPTNGKQGWGINFWREIRRYRETSSWNPVDRRIGDVVADMGMLTGITGINPPQRLFFFPYVSSYLENNGIDPGWRGTINGGLDLKYGITESFTLDMTLIPDFGQVQSDAQVLNLSPFEIRHPERRPFFTEGTELFSKADLFYSRRVGARPSGFRQAAQNLQPNEIITSNPLETSLINASKLSGRTAGGLGIGIFNGMTAPATAIIQNTVTGETREFVTQQFTNYNLIVLDQSLANNSFVSLVNTNVMGRIDGYTANVTGTDFRFLDRSGMFRIGGSGAISQQYFRNSADIFGYKYNIALGKFGGQWQYNFRRSAVSDTYNQNDMGFMSRNNQLSDAASLSFHIFEPFWRFLNVSTSLSASYDRLYNNNAFSGFDIEYNLMALFRSRLHLMARVEYSPLGERDHFEPRVAGRFFDTEEELNLFFRVSTDHRRPLYLVGDIGFERIYSNFDQNTLSFEIGPHWRVNDRMSLNYNIEVQQQNNDIGFVGLQNADNIFFGMRDIITTEQTFDGTYIFRHNLSLGFVLRHYWSTVDYNHRYFRLMNDGGLTELPGHPEEEDINFNAFTFDLRLTWNFAPGSQMTVVWKNNIESEQGFLTRGYINNFRNFIDEPQINSLSVKFLYYLDYQRIRNWRRSM